MLFLLLLLLLLPLFVDVSTAYISSFPADNYTSSAAVAFAVVVATASYVAAVDAAVAPAASASAIFFSAIASSCPVLKVSGDLARGFVC